MTQHFLILSCLIPATLVSACAGTRNRGMESVHQPVVSRHDYALTLSTPGGMLAPGEQQRLSQWLGTLRVGYGDRIAVDDTDGPAREAVARVAGGYGLLLSDEAPVPAPAGDPGTIRVVVSRMTAMVKGCNDWSRDSSVDYEQNTSSFYGCAINTNLAAMVANPEDLVHGSANRRGADPATVVKSIETYRTAKPTGGGGVTVKSESTGGGR